MGETSILENQIIVQDNRWETNGKSFVIQEGEATATKRL